MIVFVEGLMLSKSGIIVCILCLAFTFWWAWKLDAGPLIYRHSVPNKLEMRIREKFKPYLQSRSIESIRFGSKSAHISDKISVEVETVESTEEWLIANPNTGPVLIIFEKDKGEVKIHWDVPEDMPFDQSITLISDNLWDILVQYDQYMVVQRTYR